MPREKAEDAGGREGSKRRRKGSDALAFGGEDPTRNSASSREMAGE